MDMDMDMVVWPAMVVFCPFKDLSIFFSGMWVYNCVI